MRETVHGGRTGRADDVFDAGQAHPEQLTILEIYADRAAYERHIKTPHFQKYKQGTLAMVRKLELLDQIPLIPEMKMK